VSRMTPPGRGLAAVPPRAVREQVPGGGVVPQWGGYTLGRVEKPDFGPPRGGSGTPPGGGPKMTLLQATPIQNDPPGSGGVQ
jgi:hypothetical protein